MSPAVVSSTTAAVLSGPRTIQLEDRRVWAPPRGEVQVRVQATGLCGSDLHYYIHARNGDFAVRAPLVLGHESAGIVVDLPPGAPDTLKIGQRVAIEAGIYCRSCSFCQSGRYNLCRQMKFCSSAARFPHVDGTLQTVMNHPAYVLHPLPDSVSFELAALAEPLSVLIHSSRRAHLSPNQNIIVFGVGAIGLLACALAKHRGAARVVAVDINPARLEFAKREGFADDVFCLPQPQSSSQQPQSLPEACCAPPKANGVSASSHKHTHAHASTPSTPREMADEQLKKAKESAAAVMSAFGSPDGYDVVFECTGAESVIQMSIFCAMTGGKVMLIGMGTRAAYLPLSTAALREVDILGSFRYADTYREALALLSTPSPTPSSSSSSSSASSPSSASSSESEAQVESEANSKTGRSPSPSIPLPVLAAKLVTHRFPLADTKRAFEMLAKGVDDEGGLVLKVMVGSGVPC
ncbi:Sorbitol dehydrogenase [Psilocybe cubensis]|uniref:Enoyl reductase (ER) domain-containing protein n=2 Tax=Psilocybe cubensis TaxID=181762 RepID=A0A8H7XUS4_PSICU|nr:Sorbitol dehydrogenase [Psilocybe cubensis]KAH9478414.1 Sorbitol dehydrogenase [Psilocybe cubensis]